MNYFDEYGWFTATPIEGREAPEAPPIDSETTTPGEERANWTGHQWIVLPYVAPPPPALPLPPPVPASVTMRQARLALLSYGLLDDVDAALAKITDATKRAAAQIEWEYSQEVHRNNELVATLGPALGLDDEAIDGLFALAATL